MAVGGHFFILPEKKNEAWSIILPGPLASLALLLP